MDENNPIRISDPTLPDVSFDLVGRTWKLCFDFEAIAAYHEIMGVNPLLDGFDFAPLGFAATLCVGLLRYQPEVTLGEVKTWLSYKSGGELYAPVIKALSLSLPDKEETAAAAAPPDPPSA